MIMKQLFEHTSTLLRTALLLGAMILVNTQYTQAQTAEQRAAMPDAFETMNPADIIGDGKYYYIQFYNYANNICSYLTDCGANLKAKAKDFLPYTNNRLWTLEATGTTGQFRLKSKEGRYLGYISGVDGLSSNQYRFGCTDAVENAAIMTYTKVGDDYFLLMAGETDILYRVGNDEWATDLAKTGNNSGSRPYASLRFAKLKSNAAFIIYYRDGGAENSDPSASTIRHYLTYSDVDAASTVMASAVTNGSLEGADASSFFFGDPDHNAPFVASITDGAGNNGSRGIQITARGKDNPNDWDSQFFIRADEVIPEGTTFHLEFDYRASRNATVPTQAHSAPGSYITEMPNNNGINYLSFTTDWQHYSADIEVSHEMGYGRGNDKGNSFQSIAFNLWNERSTNPNTIYYFDNIKLTVPTSGSAVSSRRSIIPPDKPLSTLPTIAAYHQDGLWQLEEASADGKFYIKKYNSNEYLNCDLADPYAAAFAVLGPKDETHGQYSLVDPVASRYTLVQNVQYQTAALSPDMFYHWNGYGANASIDDQHGNTDFFFRLGQQLNSGDAVAGTGGVDYLRYADLTGYTTMIVKGTPGMIVRVLMNRQESNDGPYTLRELTIGNDGKVELDLTDLTYVHLNAIKIGWGNSGIISDIELVNRNQVNTSSPLYLNHSNGDGYPVMERNDDAANHWYAAFFPVEVPVPNKDDFFQVLVKWGDNMMAHGGWPQALPENESDYHLWQLEMVDDYKHFRLKAPNGGYLKPGGGVTAPNNPEGAENNTNEKFWTDFSLTWFYVNPVDKEIPVNHWVTHRESYLKQYSIAHSDLDLAAQGLATKAQSDWWNFGENANDPTKDTQKVNHFEITHYVKEGSSRVVEFPTVLNNNNDHVYFQRFYNYDEKDYAMDQSNANAQPMDLANLKDHVSLDTRDDGNVQYFLYKNGMVTGQKLIWKDDQGVDIPNGGMARNVLRRFNFTNSDGKRFTVGVDVSRYSDLTYDNPDTPPSGDLEEPSLTMRYVYYMRDAKEMAASLTACPEGGSKWLETKEFHFPMRRIGYELEKKVGYQGEFIGVRHVFSDYWVFDDPNLVAEYNAAVEAGTDVTYLNSHLVSAVNDNTGGKIEVEVVPNGTGIRLGGWNPTIANNHGGNLKFVDNTTDDWGEAETDFKGYYFYDKMSDGNKTDYGNSRFVVFRYPVGGVAQATGPENKAYVNVYLNNNGSRYQLAQYTIIFDPLTQTLPWKLRDENATNPVEPDANNPLKFVKDSYRDPKKLVEKAGKPIAKITFDYPANDTYHFPASGQSKQGWWTPTGGTIADCSPIPLTFGNTNYSFMGFECNWGSYSIVNKMTTNYGNHQNAAPANDNTYGYGVADVVTNPLLKSLQPDAGLQNGFLYIDASEQPGDICSAPFIGDFCSGDKLMFSGWISGSNKMGGGDNRCPGGVTLTVKGEHNLHDSEGRIIYDENGNPKKETVTLYRFCPGQCYELDDGPQDPDGSGVDGREKIVVDGVEVDNPGYDNYKYNVIWQQFYFEFTVTDKYDRHWIEVNNNCVSSQGGDFMLDNIEVYAIVPEVIPGINTPLCVNKDGTTEMRLLKLSLNFNKLKSSSGLNTGTAQEGFVFLDKYEFLKTFRTELAGLTAEQKASLHLSAFDFTTISLDELADAIEDGEFSAITGDNSAYQTAFDAAILGKKTTWYSNNPTDKMNSSIMYFEWNSDFNEMPEYSFASAVNKKHAVYREIDKDGEKWVVMNGNFPELNWKTNTDYYVINTNVPITDHNVGQQYSIFNICSQCSKASVFRIEPPYTVLGLEKSEGTDDYVVCEGQIPTVVLNLKGYDLNGNAVDMTGLNFDWWLGNNTTLATLENYHLQEKDGVKLDAALAALRSYYPSITSLDGVIKHLDKTPNLTEDQVLYLQAVVDAGELVLHQSSVNVPAKPADQEDPYFYLVACPIHDAAFNQALNPQDHQYVGYFCDEPQGLRIKVGQKAPTLKTGFVPGEHGFNTYDYAFPAGTNPVLSIRLAKAAQFETVKNSVAEVANVKNEDTGEVTYNHSVAVNYLWLPIRNAMTQTADGVIKKAMDDNIYLASTNDPTWDKKISKEMSKFGSLPVIGRIVQLTAKNTSGQSEVDLKTNTTLQKDNRLCVYFTKDFNVREGYNYTLSLPFQEQGDVNTCDGTILINLKIVPDYEVWTGGAGNTDWNNDENWRRADGNTTISNDYYGDELYRANGAVSDPNSPLHDYTTNKANYYSSSNKVNAKPSSDQILRKGFAPLYCTHILMKNDEWGNAPVLYDAIDGNGNGLTAKPFPNLRDTSTPILKFDMQARRYDMWQDTYGTPPDRGEAGRRNDLIAEMYQINSCDEIAMQPGTELLNAHLMNYNSAWMEYELDTKRWYLLGSPLQGTISGEWYAPTGNAQQKTTYYDNVTFGSGYDRYSPAIYQRSWDKAKAVLYEVGAGYATTDDSQTENLGNSWEGSWNNDTWKDPTGETDGTGADDYLDRLGYKPFGAKKANVAIQGIWSNTYNDAQVDYGTGGFSVMVMNHLKGNDADVKAIIRLPKEDSFYDYYGFDRKGGDVVSQYEDIEDIGTNTPLSDVRGKGRALNRGRLKTDQLLPDNVTVSVNSTDITTAIKKTEATASVYGDQRIYTRIPIKEDALTAMNSTFVAQNEDPATAGFFTEAVAAGASNLGYYLVENPFPCGLDMTKFFAANPKLQTKYWILTKGDGGNPRQQLVQQAGGEWVTSDGATVVYPNPNYVEGVSQESEKNLTFYPNAVVAPGQGFFVEIVRDQSTPPATITFTKAMQVQSRFGVIDGAGREFTIVVGQAQQMRKLRKLVDTDEDGIPDTESTDPNADYETIDVDLNGNGIYGETGITIGEGEEAKTVDEIELVWVPEYETDDQGNYVLDESGNKKPILNDIWDKVVLYKYKQEELTQTANKEYPLRTRGEGAEAILPGLVITAERDNYESSALVMQRGGASNDFLPEEDTEVFINSDFENAPTVYTLCGRLATTINTLRDFRSLPIGVESTSDAPCTLTFRGVEMLGDSISFYDAVEQKLTPLESGMSFKVSGQTQNRYYLVRSLNLKDAAEETHLQIFTEGLKAKVIASTAEPITVVRCFDTAGRLICTASPQLPEYSFDLPRAGVYIIEAETEHDRKTRKVIVK